MKISPFLLKIFTKCAVLVRYLVKGGSSSVPRRQYFPTSVSQGRSSDRLVTPRKVSDVSLVWPAPPTTWMTPVTRNDLRQ